MLARILSAALLCAAGASTTAGAHPFACMDNGHNKVFLVSAEGKIVWEYPAMHGQDVWKLPNGNILFCHVRGAKEVTRGKKVVWQYQADEPNEVHSCQPLPDGNVLVGECGTCRLIEIDRQGKIRKQIPLKTTTQDIHLQFRICRKTPGETYLVAFTGEQVVREYDAGGRVIRTIPVPGILFAALRLPNGNTLIACGDGHKLIEVDPQGKTVWQIDENELPGNPLRFVAGLQRLPNGNTVVCNWGGHGYLGKQPQVFEVTRDKKVVWKLFDTKQFRTISAIHLLDVPGDVTKGEICR